MNSQEQYRLVRLPNGAHSVHALAYGETCHPVVGPVTEAESLYVRQLGLRERFASHQGEFVVWDVGLGAAANAVAVLQALRGTAGQLRLVSFDNTLEPLQFALGHSDQLPYLREHQDIANQIARDQRGHFSHGDHHVAWETHVADFPSLLRRPVSEKIPAPHAICFDPYSPARNPAMWTAALFADLFRHLGPDRPCALATYSRSTAVRVALLLAGFFVGAGRGIGAKEETTIAATVPGLVPALFDARWLHRVRLSSAAEPLSGPTCRPAKIQEATWNRLRQCSQFQ